MNSCFTQLLLAAVLASLTFSGSLRAELRSATMATPTSTETVYVKLGAAKNPAGHGISLNSRSLLFDGQPVFPAMGDSNAIHEE